MTGYLFSGVYTPRIINRPTGEDVVLGLDVRAFTPALYQSAVWTNENIHKSKNLFGDITVWEIYTGMFEYQVSIDEYRQDRIFKGTVEEFESTLYDDTFFFGSYEHTVSLEPVHYFVINDMLYSNYNYLFQTPLPKQDKSRFDNSHSLNKVYDNNQISIYENNLKNT
jgi:hypothetical protein